MSSQPQNLTLDKKIYCYYNEVEDSPVFDEDGQALLVW